MKSVKDLYLEWRTKQEVKPSLYEEEVAMSAVNYCASLYITELSELKSELEEAQKAIDVIRLLRLVVDSTPF